MRPENWLEAVFGTRSKIKLLRLLAREPSRTWTAREAAAFLGMSPAAANDAAKRLRDVGVLEFQKVGASHGIRIRDSVKVGRLLQSIFHQERRTTDEWRRAIAKAVPPGTACYLFGSTARGTAGGLSDVDILVVSNSQNEADEVAAHVRAAGTRVIPAPLEILALDRVRATRQKDTPLLRSIRREGIPLTKTRLEMLH